MCASHKASARDHEGETPLHLDTYEQVGTPALLTDTDEAGHHARLERYARSHRRALEQAQWLTESPSISEYESDAKHSTAARLVSCGAWLVFRNYHEQPESERMRLASGHLCDLFKLCPICAARRGGRCVQRYGERCLHVLNEVGGIKPYLVTLTMRNSWDLEERFKAFMDSKKRLVQRRRDAMKGRVKSATLHWDGFAGSVEIKRGANSGLWHPHVHLVVLSTTDIAAPELQAQLSDEWKSITGDSHVVDVRPFLHPEDPYADLCEVFKYAVKFSTLDYDDAWTLQWSLKGRRFIFAGGSLYGVKLPDLLDDCPDDPHDDPYTELMYEYAEIDSRPSYELREANEHTREHSRYLTWHVWRNAKARAGLDVTGMADRFHNHLADRAVR